MATRAAICFYDQDGNESARVLMHRAGYPEGAFGFLEHFFAQVSLNQDGGIYRDAGLVASCFVAYLAEILECWDACSIAPTGDDEYGPPDFLYRVDCVAAKAVPRVTWKRIGDGEWRTFRDYELEMEKAS